MKIKTGKLDVLNSGSVITEQESSLTFYLGDDPSSLTAILEFLIDNTKEESYLIREVSEEAPHILTIKLYNFNNTLGTGFEPFDLGTFSFRKLYFGFWIYALPESKSKLVHYSWYLGEEEKNG